MKLQKKNETGQATVEIALLIPILVVFIMVILQVGVVVKQQILVNNASRVSARELSVNKDTSYAKSLVYHTVPKAQVDIDRPSSPGKYLTVNVKDTVKSSIPIIGVVMPDITVSSQTTMRVEK